MSQITSQFYEAFKNHDIDGMNSLYHENVIFNDPVFKNLNFKEVTSMWKMLVERSNGKLEISYHSLLEDENLTQCTWEAKYNFSKTNRLVHNVIHATMEFKEEKIIKHTDSFDFWRWSSMALGLPGKLLGWTPLIKKKVQKMARQSLDKYMTRH